MEYSKKHKMAMKVKKVKKAKKMRGKGMGTHGWGARKKHMGSGHRGGFGMAGTGKKADHKKSLILVKFKKYFGKQGETSKSTKRKKNNVMNLDYIQKNLESLTKKYGEKDILNLKDYKILGTGELTSKIKIKAKSASETAKEKIKKAGGEISIPEIKEKPKVETKVVKEDKKLASSDTQKGTSTPSEEDKKSKKVKEIKEEPKETTEA